MSTARLLLTTMGAMAFLQGRPHDHGTADHAPAAVQYIKNLGQWPGGFLYKVPVKGATAFLEADGITWSKLEEGADEREHSKAGLPLAEQYAMTHRGHAWRMRFQGSRTGIIPVENHRYEAYHNYFLGNDRSRWRGHVPLFGEVSYPEVWPGVDVVFHGTEGNMKYDMLLAAGADPDRIRFTLEGLDGLDLNEQGDLELTTSVGKVVELHPVAFYADGAKEPIVCDFTLRNGRVGFRLAAGYDSRRPVVIDPVLIASTLSGATGSSNYGHCATYDDQANIYSGARNFGPSYPATTGAFQTNMGGGGTDMSFSKYNPDGSELIWASYLGGSSGENPHSLIVNSLGQLCILGSTGSSNFPVTTDAYDTSLNGGDDMTISVVAADGSVLLGSTFIGGSGSDGLNEMYANYGEAYRGEIFVDAANNVLVASFSSSTDFPTTDGVFQPDLAGGQDGVVLSVNNTCSNLLWSTFLGGAQNDGAFGIRLQGGDILVSGHTISSDFPTTAGSAHPTALGASDAFVVRLGPGAATLDASSFFGGSGDDRCYFMDTDRNGDIWIYGQTDSDIVLSPDTVYGIPDGGVYVAKFRADLTAVPIVSRIGQSQWGEATAPVAFLVDICDNIYISGYNSSDNLPVTSDALYTSGSFYLAAFAPDMDEILFGTYYGGSHVDGGTSRFDKNGVVYQGVCSGTGSLQTTDWAWAEYQSIGWDIGVFKIDFQQIGVNADITASATTGCAPATIDFTAGGQYVSVEWDFGDNGATSTEVSPQHTYQEAGSYLVTLIGYDPESCNLSDTSRVLVVISPQDPVQPIITVTPGVDCDPFTVSASSNLAIAGTEFEWDMGDGTLYTTPTVVHTYAGPGQYVVTFTASNILCSTVSEATQTIQLENNPSITPEFTAGRFDHCMALTVTTANLTQGPPGLIYSWDMGDSTLLVGENVVHTYNEPGIYIITLIATDPLCGDQAEFSMEVVLDPVLGNGGQLIVPNVFTPNGDGHNDTFFPILGGGDGVKLRVYNRWGMMMYESASSYKPWTGTLDASSERVPDGVYYYTLDYDIPCAGQRLTGREVGHVSVLR